MFGQLGEKVKRGVSSAYQLGSKAYGFIKPLADKATKTFKGVYESPLAQGAWGALKGLLPEGVVSGLESAGGLAYKGVGLYNKAGDIYRGYVEPGLGLARRAVGLGERVVKDVTQSVEQLEKEQDTDTYVLLSVSARGDYGQKGIKALVDYNLTVTGQLFKKIDVLSYGESTREPFE